MGHSIRGQYSTMNIEEYFGEKERREQESSVHSDLGHEKPVQKVEPEESLTIPVVSERVVVSKEVVETGRVVIRKRVLEEEVSVNVPIVQEGYQVERVPGDKQLLREYPQIRYEGGNMIVPVVREVMVVEKRFEVIEELHVIKTTSELPHVQQVTLRKEDVHIERKSSNG